MAEKGILAQTIGEMIAEAATQATSEVDTNGGVDEVDIAAMFSAAKPTEPRTALARWAARISPFRKGRG